jgi:hypothetical protein
MAANSRDMFGVGRTLSDGKEVFVEYLRLTVDRDGVVYCAAPGGRVPATEFCAVEYGSQRAVFERLEHDFPQRIIYELQSDGTIKARIEGKVNGTMKSSEWVFHRIY